MPIPSFAVRLEGDRLLGPLRGLHLVARTKGRLGETTQRAAQDVRELTPLPLDPSSFLSGQERRSSQRRSPRGSCFRVLEIVRSQRGLRFAQSIGRGDDVDPAAFRQVQPVSPERAGEDRGAVEAALGEQTAQLAHDHGQRLLPRRGRRLPPERVRELVPWHCSPLLGNQVGEQEPTLPRRKALLAREHAAGLDRDSTCKENLQLQCAAHFLPKYCSYLGAAFYRRCVESMEKVLQCDCGFEARAENEDGLVAEVRRHAWAAHGMALSPDEALLLTFRAELDATAPSRKAGSEAIHDPSSNVMSDLEEER